MKILLIEDSIDISNNIKNYLELENHVVDTAFDWSEWLDKAITGRYDVVLLDLMLPEIDWFTVCEKINLKNPTPIIMITAKDSIEDKLKWFEKWTLDYLVKPFDLRELEARILSITSRNKKQDILIYNEIEVDIKNRIFKKSWKEVNITQKEFLIIEMLINNLKSWVSRTDIIEHVWWESELFEADAKLDVYISTIRSKLDKKIIKTIKWYWYKILSQNLNTSN